MIDGVTVKPLKVIADERGYLMEVLRSDDRFFRKFGQAYVTVCYPDVVKGWHYHKVQWDAFVVVSGMAKVVLYDWREGSKTKGEVNEYFMGDKNPILVTIPPNVLHGFKATGGASAMLFNAPSEPYDSKNPDEHRLAPHGGEVPYDWARKDG